jgi:non-specific serine/threonine protein kinase
VGIPPLERQRGMELPLPSTPLIGRERETARVLSWLRGEARLVTLTGVGGSGKTRLALHAAACLAAEIPRVVWVPLAPIADPALVPAAIGHALSLPAGGPLLERLVAALRAAGTLLVLDNYEHRVGAATVAADLLAACPGLHVLVTSRAPLRLTGEHEVPIGPLALPLAPRPRRFGATVAAVAAGDQSPSDLATIAAAPAVQLFVQRVCAVRPDFALTSENASEVAEVCARLDGLPLAIELAAARARLLTPTALRARLGRRLALLTGGARDLPVRQQTLRATIEWSYSLLGAVARALFARLAVLVGEWTLGDAEALGADLCGAQEDAVLDFLTELADMGLVLRRDPPGDAGAAGAAEQQRFGMLETIREFALERLAELGQEEAARRRHAIHFLSLARSAGAALRGPDQVRWLNRLEASHANLSAALHWWSEAAAADIVGVQAAHPLLSGLQMAGALWRYWWVRGYLMEGRSLAAPLLILPLPPGPPDEAAALSAARAEVAFGAGVLAFIAGDYAAAEPLFHQALALWRATGDEEGIAYAIDNLGVVDLALGHFVEGLRLLREAVDRFRALGESHGAAWPLASQGVGHLLTGDAGAARMAIEESLALFHESGDAHGEAQALEFLAFVLIALDEDVAAGRAVEATQTLRRRLGEQATAALSLEAAALLAGRRGDRPEVERLLAEAAARRVEAGVRDMPALCAYVDAQLAAALARGGPETTRSQPAGGARERRGDVPLGDPLTAREREVAVLVAQGLSNRQIAERLIITPGTAGVHVTHILDKLGLHTRAQIAAWAVRHGLLAPVTQ